MTLHVCRGVFTHRHYGFTYYVFMVICWQFSVMDTMPSRTVTLYLSILTLASSLIVTIHVFTYRHYVVTFIMTFSNIDTMSIHAYTDYQPLFSTSKPGMCTFKPIMCWRIIIYSGLSLSSSRFFWCSLFSANNLFC